MQTNIIGRNLKMFRLLKGLSLRKAGNILDMTATAIMKYENGQLIPNSKKIIEFDNAYGVKCKEILNTEERKITITINY